MTTNHAELVQLNREHTLSGWTSQEVWDPISCVRAEGVHFWDADGKQYLDWSSQLFNVNIGHQHPHVISALQQQTRTLCYAYPGIATQPRATLAERLLRRLPPNFSSVFFTLGGADAIENAIKMARLSTGREKILTRYRAYHGATFGAMTAGGDPRRLANEPGVPWIVHIHDPYAYRSPIYAGRTQAEGDQVVAQLLEETVHFEGPERIAAILLEGYSGSSGIIQGGEEFWSRVQDLCNRHGILLIIDEVLSGFGRTGTWFGFNHYPYLEPDILVMAKGLTSGYAPLGAVVVDERIADYFENNTLWGGLTYSAHPLGCAAGIANLDVYENEDLIDRAAQMGEVLADGLKQLADEHPCIGDVRGAGLHYVLELVKDRQNKTPLSEWNQPPNEPMKGMARSLRSEGMSTFVKWNYVFCSPPLVITERQIQQGVNMLDRALKDADRYYTK